MAHEFAVKTVRPGGKFSIWTTDDEGAPFTEQTANAFAAEHGDDELDPHVVVARRVGPWVEVAAVPPTLTVIRGGAQ